LSSQNPLHPFHLVGLRGENNQVSVKEKPGNTRPSKGEKRVSRLSACDESESEYLRVKTAVQNPPINKMICNVWTRKTA
jgi:hypothetical protein